MSTDQYTVDWDTFAPDHDHDHDHGYDPDFDFDFDAGFGPATGAGPAQVQAPDVNHLAHATPAERTRLIDTYVRQELGRVLGMAPHTIDTTGRPMNSLGVGSINGLELQARMEAALGVDVNLQSLLRANSAAELIDCLAGQLGSQDSPHKHRAHPAAAPLA
ncbi:acyl carrier protein [Streptomyces sp. ISL-11]|uniref:acyl carrier protein n=1 Tax=Streptomyces sp. ISL-11 TaxID=2819174 RepID=UPI001BE81BEC|nr:acyl carrier protein [Streptomyces sp. ISL-11]MBT2386309.1 acyl carrier protein [Streptomyces sp. ISL-11]